MKRSPDEIVDRRRTLYEREVQVLVEPEHAGESVVRGTDFGGFKLGRDYHAVGGA